MAHFQDQHDKPAAMSDEQFAELKALLAPGFELSTLMLADYKAQRHAMRDPDPEVEPKAPKADADSSSSES